MFLCTRSLTTLRERSTRQISLPWPHLPPRMAQRSTSFPSRRSPCLSPNSLADPVRNYTPWMRNTCVFFLWFHFFFLSSPLYFLYCISLQSILIDGVIFCHTNGLLWSTASGLGCYSLCWFGCNKLSNHSWTDICCPIICLFFLAPSLNTGQTSVHCVTHLEINLLQCCDAVCENCSPLERKESDLTLVYIISGVLCMIIYLYSYFTWLLHTPTSAHIQTLLVCFICIHDPSRRCHSHFNQPVKMCMCMYVVCPCESQYKQDPGCSKCLSLHDSLAVCAALCSARREVSWGSAS